MTVTVVIPMVTAVPYQLLPQPHLRWNLGLKHGRHTFYHCPSIDFGLCLSASVSQPCILPFWSCSLSFCAFCLFSTYCLGSQQLSAPLFHCHPWSAMPYSRDQSEVPAFHVESLASPEDSRRAWWLLVALQAWDAVTVAGMCQTQPQLQDSASRSSSSTVALCSPHPQLPGCPLVARGAGALPCLAQFHPLPLSGCRLSTVGGYAYCQGVIMPVSPPWHTGATHSPSA